MEISGINEKNMDDKKFIYIPAIVSNSETTIGIEILSLTLGIVMSSVRVASNETINEIINGISKKYRIRNVVMKNAKLPSKDLVKSFVFPKPTPIIAAIASAKLITINAIPATFGLKRIYVSSAPQNTNVAPVNFFDSNERVIDWK